MEREFILISLKHTDFENKLPVEFVMWKDNYSGYTSDLKNAGRYYLSKMREHWKGLPSWLKVADEKMGWDELVHGKFDTLAVPLDSLKKFGFVERTVLMKE